MLRASYHSQVFDFVFKVRTSRGEMKRKTSWFLKIWDDENPGTAGVGECSPLPGLSDEYDCIKEHLDCFVARVNNKRYEQPPVDDLDDSLFLMKFFGFLPSSLSMALEMALRDLHFGGKKIIYDNSSFFQQPIPINGLIWMGDRKFMVEQIDKKIALGFDCLKLKIGALDFAAELEILSWIRSHYSQKKLTLRLDANGAFSKDNVFEKLEALANYDIHSIEQPVPPQDREWRMICKKSPIPIALDESLINIEPKMQEKFLDDIKPQFLVLKPSLHGSFSTCRQWIKEAVRRNIGWWITSALESNIGLNAIAQFAGTFPLSIPQGLGTGELYSNNVESPLIMRDCKLFYDKQKK